MKKFILFSIFIFSFFITHYSFSQSGWVSTFFNNTNGFERIIKRDSINFIAFCGNSKYFYKSNDAGNNWSCLKDYSFNTTLGFYDAQFINVQTGWVIGENPSYRGIILKTTNGGLNWFEQSTGYDNYEYSRICFLNENTGWIGAWGINLAGRLFKTTNGGINWLMQEFTTASQIVGLKFFNENNGWIMGFNKYISRTTDGGQTWVQKPINNVPSYYNCNINLYPLNNNECWAILESANSGIGTSHIFKTTNGGDNWNLTYSYSDSLLTNSNHFWNINFINSSSGFSNGGFKFIIRTTNSGINWSKINVLPFYEYNPYISSLLPINNDEIFSTCGFSTTNYFPCSYILKSTNRGLNWSIKSYNWELSFSQIEFIDQNSGFVISDTGRLYKTTNSGVNWNLNINNNNYWFREISFANSSTGCIIGSPHYSDYYGRILRTTNSGSNWIEVYNSSSPFYSLRFKDQLTGWIGCDSNRLLKTTNAGLNWNLIELSAPKHCNILNINFLNSSTGWILGYHYYSMPPYYSYEREFIWKTTNSGNNWNILYDSIGHSCNYFIQYVDNNIGYKISKYYDNKLQKTTNGGINWFNINVPYLTSPSCFKYLNQNTGWIAGYGGQGQINGMIIKTTNAGVSWNLQFSEQNKIIRSIFVFNSDNAWFCGDYSSIYKTTNGGGTIGIKSISKIIPDNFSLSQNYPNPFNPNTNIKYQITNNKLVTLKIFDILGKEVATLFNEKQSPGTYEVNWDGSAYPSGVYFYKLVTGDFTETKKMLMIK